MASFPNVRHHLPSAYAEGFPTFVNSSSPAGILPSAARTAPAHSELATLQGNHAVQSTLKHLTETPRAPQLAALSVKSSAFSNWGERRG